MIPLIPEHSLSLFDAAAMTVATPPATTLSTPSPTERFNPLDLDEDDMAARPIYLIVATSKCSSRLGIGFQNSLPWPLIKSDMAFFQKVTRDSRPPSAATPGSINAVIMGRKTYESVPAKFRPLGGRLNVVISRTSAFDASDQAQQSLIDNKKASEDTIIHRHTISSPEGGHGNVLLQCKTDIKGEQHASNPHAVAPILNSQSLKSALSALTSTALSKELGAQLGNVCVIGGAEIYSSLLQNNSTGLHGHLRILQTEVRKVDGSEFECDTFFPVPLHAENSEWALVDQDTVSKWINTTSDEGSQIQLPQQNEEWARDDKVGVELRVLGWEQKPSDVAVGN